ncbi:MAG TPA: septal ring lytic transglycosylase RlpA family protein [Micromonosporaceae bacterium]
MSGRHALRRSPRLPRNLVPIASALAVVGVLVGGTVTTMLTRPTGRVVAGPATPAPTSGSPSADPTRSQAAQRASRSELRPMATPGGVKPSPRRSTSAPTVVGGGTCEASYYSDGQRTADGETFNPDAYTAAHRTLPFNTRVRVTNTANGKSVVVRINDRGPYVAGRCLDLSRAAFGAIASYSSGVVTVKYEVLG